MSGWVGAECELSDEAMRVLPALAKARLAGSIADSAVLLSGYTDEARRLGVPPERAWLVFATAAVKWMARMFEREALIDGGSAEQAADAAITMAVAWAAGVD